jgi:hypothetical protein
MSVAFQSRYIGGRRERAAEGLTRAAMCAHTTVLDADGGEKLSFIAC